MEEFFTILTPMAQCFVDNFNYILLAAMLYCYKNTRSVGIMMILGFMFWGFQTWIVIVSMILAFLCAWISNAGEKYIEKKKKLND